MSSSHMVTHTVITQSAGVEYTNLPPDGDADEEEDDDDWLQGACEGAEPQIYSSDQLEEAHSAAASAEMA